MTNFGAMGAPVDERLDALALAFDETAWSEEPINLREYLRDHATSLTEFARQVREEYARTAGGEGEAMPTNAQGIALARFLRGHFNSVADRDRYANVSAGGAGLPGNYLYVRLSDGYEGGIAPNGDTST